MGPKNGRKWLHLWTVLFHAYMPYVAIEMINSQSTNVCLPRF